MMDDNTIDKKVSADGAVFAMQQHWHNRFHLEMPAGVLQNPDGMAFYEEEYHLFCPWHAEGDESSREWFHVHTRDFVRYSQPEKVYWPEGMAGNTATFAGCIYVKGGRLYILYLDSVSIEGGRQSLQLHIGRLENNHVVPCEGEAHLLVPDGYRVQHCSPSLFWRNGKGYLALGAQTAEKYGCILLYGEDGEGGWSFQDELHTQLGSFGTLWSSPRLVRFGLHDVLLLAPQGLLAEPLAYENTHVSGYLAGQFSTAAQELLHGRFQELDHGFDFYAPQHVCHAGRNILFGWLGMPDQLQDYPAVSTGWRFALTIPRMLMLRRGHIYSQPVPELEALRVASSARELMHENTAYVSACLPEGAEIILDIVPGHATQLCFHLVYGLERIQMHYDREEQLIWIDRSSMKLGLGGIRTFRLHAEDTFSLHIFVDKSIVEVFLQHGEEVATFFVFPEKHILPELVIDADGEMERVAGQIWSLEAMK